MKLCAVIPSGDDVKFLFMASWCAAREELRDMAVQVIGKQSSLLPKSRQDLLEDALATGCDVILWMDSDMVFPTYAPRRLIAAALEHGRAVGVDYVRRSVPYERTACRLLPENEREVEPIPLGDGLFEAFACGLGLVAIPAELARALPKPWFLPKWFSDEDCTCDPERKTPQGAPFHAAGCLGRWQGEDAAFFQLQHQIGRPVLIDRDLSREVFHLGLVPLPLRAAPE